MRLRALPEAGLYALLDLEVLAARGAEDLCEVAEALVAGGARVLQLRAKNVSTATFVEAARGVAAVTRARGVSFIVNDRVDVARLVEADGVHLGQDDLSVEAARAQLGPKALIGLSTHTQQQWVLAQGSGADYLGLGPVFATSTKANADPVVGVAALAAACAASRLPVAAIGGVRLADVAALRAAGAHWSAVVSDLYAHGDLAARARAFCEAWSGPS